MPWKETCVMDERIKFIAACREPSEDNFAALCRRFGISRKTGYNWVQRYEERGPEGLMNRPSIARHCPHAREQELVERVVLLRKEHPHWGPKKLRGYLREHQQEIDWPAASTMGDWLRKYGLIRPHRRRLMTSPALVTAVGRGQYPNDVWCADFKGWFRLGNKTKCYPLTISDEYSRYLLKCEGMVTTTGPQVKVHFERAFEEFGLPRQMRTDNGPPFASTGVGGLSALSVWWIKLGIEPVRIEPGKPQQNGRHERIHRTLLIEMGKPAQDEDKEQLVLSKFRRDYNEERPHEALGQTSPAKHYAPSRRAMPKGKLSSPEYPDMTVRWVHSRGHFSFAGQRVPVSQYLAREPLGLRQCGATTWEVFYGPVRLGELDERDGKLRHVTTVTGAKDVVAPTHEGA